MSRRKKQTFNARDKTDYFSRSDDEVELLQYLTLNKRLKKKLTEDMILALTGQFKQLSLEPEKFR